MNISLDHNKIRTYIMQYNLERIFSDIDSIPLQLRMYKKHEIIMDEGDDLDGVYWQVEGQTKVTTSVQTGKSILLRFCHPISIFGDIEIIQKTVIQSRVEAITESCFLFIDRRTVENQLMQDFRFLQELLKHLSYKLQTCTSALSINLLATVEERFASYLITTRLPIDFGKEIQASKIQDIASVIGTTPRHLNRLIHKLSESGIILKNRSGFTILKWDELESISGGLRY